MKQPKIYLYLLFLSVNLSAGFVFASSSMGQPCEGWSAKIVSVQGIVQVRKAGESKWMPVGLNATYCPGDMVRVLKNSRAAIVLSNETLFRLNQNTTITFIGLNKEKTSFIEILKGAAHFLSRFPKRLKVVAPFVNATVEGTEFYVRVEYNQTLISIFEGQVSATNEFGRLVLTSGQSAVTEAGKAPVLKIVVRPRDAVHWALYYLPVIYVPPGKAPKEDMRDPRFLVYRASQLLAVGRVDEARADIKRALSLDPKYSDAFALQSIIAVVQNDKEKALSSAQKAIDTGPNSAPARIAMSYAQQASFDLEGARANVEEAIDLDPNNALAWARLAELWSSFGNLTKALYAAKKSVKLDPNLSRTQMILGFAYLTQVKTAESKAAFEKAIVLDQADPFSRLGLGLAKIREGDLKAGGREIEIAVSLDPNNSIVRSYLGKTYFEEKRTGLDEREYAIAKQLDPSDPTPYFYDAIAKQTTNRPVEALYDLQKAIELNDNRAVFRSRLLLDSDEAARSASLARIYSDLGFQQRALVEGWKAVSTDPSNFSAHRLLADSYSVLPRYGIARVSELLQSQLLQPINIAPVQPSLAESNLFTISAQGPATPSFQEFNPLFNRNQIALNVTGILGENSAYGGEGVVSGIYNKLSFSGGYSHFETDGWRKNSNLDDDIVNVFGQLELTHKTSLQAEYRYRNIETGDIRLLFFEDEFYPNLEGETETSTWRLGFRQAFSPSSIFIGNFSYQDLDDTLKDTPDPIFSIKLDSDQDAYGGELQYLFRSKFVNFVAGGGHFDVDRDDTTIVDIGFVPRFEDKIDFGFEHNNFYLYSYVKPLENMTVTLGGSGDFQDADNEETKERDQFNPKFGLTWHPLRGTTVRGAALRVLKRTLIADQTIEPTQVAGFNQFFNDPNSTDYWVYGGAIDQRFNSSIYGGAEYTYRSLNVPFLTFDEATFTEKLDNSNWDENIFRTYLFWTPHNWLSLTGEYLYEKLDRDQDFAYGAKKVTTHSVPLGINFFHPSGLSASLKATFVDQDGEFERSDNFGAFEAGDDRLWLIDAAIRYRFPKRYGFVTVGVTNLFDQDFEYFDTDIKSSVEKPIALLPRIQPDRTVFLNLTLAF